MTDLNLDVGSMVVLQKERLDDMLGELRSMGFQTIGPRIKDMALTYAPITGLADLPLGFTSEQDAGHYRLVKHGHDRYFDLTPGAASWKQFFFPPRQEMFTAQRVNGSWTLEANPPKTEALALIGVRPCELAAIQIQDRVFLRDEWYDPYYRAHRVGAFILAVNCLQPCGTCFCASMGTGPQAESGYDLVLTELDDGFLIEIGSEIGRTLMETQEVRPASAFLLQTAQRGLQEAESRMGRQLPHPETLPEDLLNNLEHPRWDDVAERCLSCTSCTQVCPTCFCWDTFDTSALDGQTATRVRVWDSCFNPDYSYIAGGNTRPNTRSRYRQWLTHKLASWHHQFDTSGCVGCGRCITWCPAGIDITAEVAALREEAVS
jgi:ferredoxin